MHQMTVILERDICSLQQTAALNIDRVIGVHQNIADCRIIQKRFNRAEAEHLIDDLLRKLVTFDAAQRNTLSRQKPLNQGKQLLLSRTRLVELTQSVQVETLDQFLVNC